MAEYELVESRVISGKGVLKLPSDSVPCRASILYTDIVREPRSKYLNLEWNPPRSRYANLCFLRKGYVMFNLPVEFEHQVFDGINDTSGQTLIALKCAYEGILATFINLGLSLGKTITYYDASIKGYENLYNAWDEVRIKCYADTAIQVRLYQIMYDVCIEGLDNTSVPLEPSPQVPKVPLGTAVPNSRPYSGDTGDNGNTVPFSGDGVEPLPSAPGSWLLTWNDSNGANSSVTYPGISTDTWSIVGGVSAVCNSSGRSSLWKNGNVVIEDPWNCNSFGFISTLVSQVFTPS